MKKTGTFPPKIEVLLKCLPDAPFKDSRGRWIPLEARLEALK